MFRQRTFKPADLDRVMDVVHQCIRDTYTPEFFLNVSSLWQEGFLVTESQSGIVAFAMGLMPGPQQSRLLLLATLPPYRMKGLGGTLLDGFMENSRKAGATSMSLEVRVSNEKARVLQAEGLPAGLEHTSILQRRRGRPRDVAPIITTHLKAI